MFYRFQKQSALVVLFAYLHLKETWSKLSSQANIVVSIFHLRSTARYKLLDGCSAGTACKRDSFHPSFQSLVRSEKTSRLQSAFLFPCSYFRSSLIQSGSAVRNLSNSSFETLALARLCSEEGFVLKTISLSLKPR